MVLAVGLGLSGNAAVALWGEADQWARAKTETLLATARVVAASASGAIAAQDSAGVAAAMKSIGGIPGVMYSEARTRDGALIASAGQAARLAGDLQLAEHVQASSLDLLRTRTVAVEVPAVKGGLRVGSVRLVSDTEDLWARLRDVLRRALGGALLAMAVGLAVSLRLQRAVLKPLLALTRTMSDVAHGRVYRAKVPVDRQDEIGVLAGTFNRMIAEIEEREQETVTRLVRAAEYRDTDTGEHISRVAGYAKIVAKGLGFSSADCELLGFASTMHDVGKLGVPDSILLKRGPLTPEERIQMEHHAEAGFGILKDSRSRPIQLAAEIALSHHEKWDGTGYPRRLKGADIPLAGRIVAVADVFDALTSERPYKKAWTLDAARAFLVEQAGRHFDPACVAAFVEGWPEVVELWHDLRASEQDVNKQARPSA
jgi:HD-GYP domain-containing protein (c-di-GMP phosphodiesterase class II)